MFNFALLMSYCCEHGAGAVSRRFQSSVTQCLVVAFFSDGDGVCDQQERDRRGQKNDRGMTLYDSSTYAVSLLLRSRHAVVGFKDFNGKLYLCNKILHNRSRLSKS